MSIVESLRLPALRDGAKVIGNEAVAPSLRGNRKSGDDVFDSYDASSALAPRPCGAAGPLWLPHAHELHRGQRHGVREFQFQGVDDEDLSNYATSCGVVREIASLMTPAPEKEKKNN